MDENNVFVNVNDPDCDDTMDQQNANNTQANAGDQQQAGNPIPVAELVLQLQNRIVELTQLQQHMNQQHLADRVDMVDIRNRLHHADAAAAAGGAAGAPVGPVIHYPAPPWNNNQQPPRLPQLTFENTESDDWLMFRQAFLNHLRYYRCDDEQGRRALLSCMRGLAFRAISALDHEGGLDLQQLLAEYERKFLPPAASDTARMKFETAVQGAKEDILPFHGRLLTLYQRAWPDIPFQPRQLIRAFARALNRRGLRLAILRRDPATYEEALDLALREQAAQVASLAVPGTAPAPGGAGAEEPMEIGALTKDARCYNCDRPGHIARDCRARPRAGGSSTGGAPAGAAAAAANAGARPKANKQVTFAPNKGAGGYKKKADPPKKNVNQKGGAQASRKSSYLAQLKDLVAKINELGEESDEGEEDEDEGGEEEGEDVVTEGEEEDDDPKDF
jgi:hypothetical protein